jgi:Putative adhesin
MTVRRVAVSALVAVVLGSLAACSAGRTTTDEQSYEISEQVSALVVDGRAAAITVEAGEGPVTVTEVYRYGDDRPGTSHRLDGTTLTLTDTGCQNDERRCDVEFRVRVPRATTLTVTAKAGAVKVNGLAGNVMVTTEAGVVEANGLAGDEVTITTQAGATSLEFAKAPKAVKVSTQLGAVDVRLPTGTAYAVDVATDLGASDVSVQRDAASAHRIQVKTEVGAIRVKNT